MAAALLVRPSKGEDYVIVECCRKCSAMYQFKLENNDVVTVLCGRPHDQKYKAVSYLWEGNSQLPLECRRCSLMTLIPMRDSNKLWGIMRFVRGGSTIWLDAMSIDQKDSRDLEAQLVVMGDIYRKAETVSVYLPRSDEEAYNKLKELCITADTVVKRQGDFGMSSDDHAWPTPPELMVILSKLADDFSMQITEWTENIHKWNYWQRAWTFQEWAMASEIEISWESAPNKEGLKNIKNVIVMASTIIGHWRKTCAKHSVIGTAAEKLRRQVHVREDVGKYLNTVRAHFPFEDFLVADEAEDPDNMRLMTFIPVLPTATDPGTYVSLKSRSNESPNFRSLLSLALNAMSTSERKATHPADRVACWASMCNIEYNYKKDDSFPVALHKVIAALRRRGIRIYNFLANTDSAETDLKFLDYAAAHRQTNAASGGYILGSPIFIGRADTVSHIQHSLTQEGDLLHLDGNFDVTLRQVDKVIFKRPIPCGNKTKFISSFRSMISGKADGERLFDVGDKVEEVLNTIPSAQLNKYLFVTMSITVVDIHIMWYFNAWAIFPSNIPLHDLFVARESLNGTLVLALYKGPKPAKEAQIISYLNMTHQRDGTYLVKTDENGTVDIVFRTADTPEHELFWIPESELSEMAGPSLLPEWNTIDILSDRVFNMQITFEKRSFSLVRAKGETKI